MSDPMDPERLADIREGVEWRRDRPMPMDDDRDGIIAALLTDRDYQERRAGQAERERDEARAERDVLAAGLQTLDETTYNATSEPFPKWVVVSMGDGAGYWINAVDEDESSGVGGTVESVYVSDATAHGRDAECEAARIAGAMNHAMALARKMDGKPTATLGLDVEAENERLRAEVARLRARVRVEADDVERLGLTRAHVEAWLRMNPRWESSTSGAWHWKPANGGVFTTLSDGKRSDELADDVHWLAKREQRSGLDILEEMATTTPREPARES
jgi:hypothetical protein